MTAKQKADACGCKREWTKPDQFPVRSNYFGIKQEVKLVNPQSRLDTL